ncbi:MAG: hypothetical protein WBA74_08110 [Cyclobacteriaceae bacterium]
MINENATALTNIPMKTNALLFATLLLVLFSSCRVNWDGGFVSTNSPEDIPGALEELLKKPNTALIL